MNLGETAISIIKEIKELNKKKAYSALLVANGNKGAGNLDVFTNNKEKVLEKIIELEQETEISIIYISELIPEEFKNPSNKENLIYYNKITLGPRIIKEFRKKLKEFKVSDALMGRVYTYPECCIKKYPHGVKSPKASLTEHLWCSEDCHKSLGLEKEYEEVINEHLL
ncbi:hypothetical protein GF352_02525 [archaeon]|nr:hypothetical protein [archaeon]